jgi:hypothetical protein
VWFKTAQARVPVLLVPATFLPWFFVSVADTGLMIGVSDLESTVAR